MLKPNQMRMKRLAAHLFQGFPRLFGQRGEPFWGYTSIDGVPDHRMADMAQMHPNLVGASGLKPAFDEARDLPEALDHTVVCDRALPLIS
jgi:hypothetical protein